MVGKLKNNYKDKKLKQADFYEEYIFINANIYYKM